ncbi:MAG: hypothetical protein HY270_21875 [Deltaproteobacteria bacterium]|nr:hypothetical protein [Deltaproteobacteria bacterium]
MNTAPRVSDLLRKFQEARLAEAEVFSELVAALAQAARSPLPHAIEIANSPGEAVPCYLSVRQLAARIPYAEHTIRNMISSGEFIEGEHYFKRRGRVMFSWPAMRAWVEQQSEQADEPEALPLVRNRRNGRS